MSGPQIVWRAGDDAPAAWPGRLATLTLAVRVRRLAEEGDLVIWPGADGSSPAARLWGSADGLLGFELSFEHKPAPLRLTAPVARLGADRSHEIAVRYFGHRLELWVDGVLVDEEWPIGPLRDVMGRALIATEAVESLQGWNHALGDDELFAVSGGREGRAERVERYLGPPRPVGQYWRPRGFNVNVGDCMPFWDEAQQRLRVFYLLDRRNHASMWGCGGHQWAQISTTNLTQWMEHPLALAIEADTAGSICTGSVFFHDGVYHAFYVVRMADRSPAPLCVATSCDGVHFTKASALVRLVAPYDAQASRDPVVFRDAATGLFHMLATTALVDPAQPARSEGCLAQLVSRDLRHWEQREPFYVPGGADHPECPDYFAWNGWYYLLFSLQGVARYRLSRQPFGPWLTPPVDTLDGPQMRVMKTGAYHGNRRIGVVFVPDRPNGYAGVIVFREIIQHPDGTLTTAWPAELTPTESAD